MQEILICFQVLNLSLIEQVFKEAHKTQVSQLKEHTKRRRRILRSLKREIDNKRIKRSISNI